MSTSDVRNKILQHAVRLFARNGYGSTSVQKLADAAGITKPTVYYHFGSKEGLFEALVDEHLGGLKDLVNETVTGPGSVAERLRTFAATYLLGALDEADAVRFMLLCGLPETSDNATPHCQVFGRVLQIVTPLQDVIQQGMRSGELRRDLDPRAAVLLLLGALNLHLAAALEGHLVGRDTVDSILKLWFHGVAA